MKITNWRSDLGQLGNRHKQQAAAQGPVAARADHLSAVVDALDRVNIDKRETGIAVLAPCSRPGR